MDLQLTVISTKHCNNNNNKNIITEYCHVDQIFFIICELNFIIISFRDMCYIYFILFFLCIFSALFIFIIEIKML